MDLPKLPDHLFTPLGFDIDDCIARRKRLKVLLEEGKPITWDDLPQTTQNLFAGVAHGWWEEVDIARSAPIPFPFVFNLRTAPKHFTMAHVVTEAKAFDSVSKARKNGWDKPITLGEFWLHKRTIRVLVIWAED